MRIGKKLSSNSNSNSNINSYANSNSKSSPGQDKQDKYGLSKSDKYGLKENKYKKFGWGNKADKFDKSGSKKEGGGKEGRFSGKNIKSSFGKLLHKNPNIKPMAPMAVFVPKKKSASLQWFFAPNNLIATFFGVGYIKYAPGTFGSLAAFPLYFIIENQISNFALSAPLIMAVWAGIIVSLFFIGAHFAHIYSDKIEEDDPGQVVIDEVVGQITTIVIASYSKIADPALNLLLCLILFRFFDIAKPLFIGGADENIGGGFGTMLDDLLAGICAGLVILLIGIII